MRFEIGKQTGNTFDNVFLLSKLFTMFSATLLPLPMYCNSLE